MGIDRRCPAAHIRDDRHAPPALPDRNARQVGEVMITGERAARLPAAGLPVSRPDAARIEALVDRAIARYLDGCHARVAGFADRHFSLRGALRLHRHAIGLDLLRAPLNTALIVVYILMQLLASAARCLGWQRPARWLATRTPFLTTNVARSLTWAIQTELLDLPFEDGQRRWQHDALAAEIVGDADLAPVLPPRRRPADSAWTRRIWHGCLPATRMRATPPPTCSTTWSLPVPVRQHSRN